MADKSLDVNEQSKSKEKQMASMTPPPPFNPGSMNIHPVQPFDPTTTQGVKPFEGSK